MLEKSPQVADASLERPPKLYHGSTDGSITQFEPRTHRARPEEGAKTYAPQPLKPLFNQWLIVLSVMAE
jgi:hypothetical protein